MAKGPTRAQLEAARGALLRDVIADDLEVLFVGINPSLYSAVVGHHFARPGNRFWPALDGSGFTPRRLDPNEDRSLLDYGAGLTNLVARATARADELEAQELVAGRKTLSRKVRRRRCGVIAVVGVSAYRVAFAQPKATLGPQQHTLGGAKVWVLPNPSGLNAHYQLPRLVELYGELRRSLRGG